MRFLRVVFKTCPRVPKDAVAHLGFKINGSKIYHLVETPRGVDYVTANCEECVFYRLATRGYVVGRLVIRGSKAVIHVEDNWAVRKVLSEYGWQVLSVKPVKKVSLYLTERQWKVLEAAANGHSLTSMAERFGVSKVAVYKTLKTALRKVVEIF
ncbi:MAG: bacteriocin [Pyrobaculum sp.]